jgi:hypothetical protein
MFLSRESRYYYHVNPTSIFQWASFTAHHLGWYIGTDEGSVDRIGFLYPGIFHYLILSVVSPMLPVGTSDLLVVSLSYWKYTGFIRYRKLRHFSLYKKRRGRHKMYHSEAQNCTEILFKNKLTIHK